MHAGGEEDGNAGDSECSGASSLRMSLPGSHRGDFNRLQLVDELHAAVADSAEAAVALEDTLAQGVALDQALGKTCSTAATLRSELDERAEARSRQSELLEDALGEAFDEQARLRSALLKSGSALQYEIDAMSDAEQRSAELFQEIEESHRVYSEVAESRSRRVAELEDWCRQHQEQASGLEAAVEMQRSFQTRAASIHAHEGVPRPGDACC